MPLGIGTTGLSVWISTGSKYASFYWGSSTVLQTATNVVKDGVWQHWAIARKNVGGSTSYTRFWLDGVEQLNSGITNDMDYGAANHIEFGSGTYMGGSKWNMAGQFSNMRVFKGVAKYWGVGSEGQGNITPPSGKLEKDTSVLLIQPDTTQSTWTDSSDSGHTLTASGLSWPSSLVDSGVVHNCKLYEQDHPNYPHQQATQFASNDKYIIHHVHFCNIGEVTETLTIFLSHDVDSISAIVKEIEIPAGETFVLASSEKLSNVPQFNKRIADSQRIILGEGEILSASSTPAAGTIVATVIYGLEPGASSSNLILTSPTPTPTPSVSLGTTSGCCSVNTNNAWQQCPIALSAGLDFLLVLHSDMLSPYSALSNGDSIFYNEIGKCIYYKTSDGNTRFNKIEETLGPVYYGNQAYTKIRLRDPLVVFSFC